MQKFVYIASKRLILVTPKVHKVNSKFRSMTSFDLLIKIEFDAPLFLSLSP